MEVLQGIFQWILDLGSTVFMPIVVMLIGIGFGLKPDRAFSAGLTLGVAIAGMGMVQSYLSGALTESVTTFSGILNGITGVSLEGLDMGWAPALSTVWSWRYVFLMFVVQIGLNVIMLAIKQTDCLNVDMWNVANQGFTAYMAYFITGNLIIGFAFGALQVFLELKNADATKYQIQELTGCPGIGMPHPMFLSCAIFYPVARLLDKIFPEESKVDCAALQQKLGIFGENHVIGFILGTAIALVAGMGTGSLAIGVMTATALLIFPLVSQLFMTALTPISEAAQNAVKNISWLKGRDLIIGLDWPILGGNAEIWVAIILTVPVAILVSMVLPGNTVMPLGNLMNVCVCAAAFVSCHGDLRKMVIISWIMVPILCWAASATTDMFTQLANDAISSGTTNANVLSATDTLNEGLKIAWWGMDIAEIRWSWIEACKMNPIGIAASIGYLVLFFAYYLPQMKKEEKAAAERMGVEYLEA